MILIGHFTSMELLFANIKVNYAKIKHNWDKAPDAQMTIAEFQECGGQVHVIKGELFYDMTEDEKKQTYIAGFVTFRYAPSVVTSPTL